MYKERLKDNVISRKFDILVVLMPPTKSVQTKRRGFRHLEELVGEVTFKGGIALTIYNIKATHSSMTLLSASSKISKVANKYVPELLLQRDFIVSSNLPKHRSILASKYNNAIDVTLKEIKKCV